MRTLPLLGALALFGLAAQPASAQMCGGSGQQAQASTAQGGMMCGGMGAAVGDPMADKPAQKPQQQSGMCPCCRNMAMMRGGMGGGMQHDMPGMGQPKQQ